LASQVTYESLKTPSLRALSHRST